MMEINKLFHFEAELKKVVLYDRKLNIFYSRFRTVRTKDALQLADNDILRDIHHHKRQDDALRSEKLLQKQEPDPRSNNHRRRHKRSH